MSSNVRIVGTLIDVNTYVVVNRSGLRIAEVDGGLLALTNIRRFDQLDAINPNTTRHALLNFDAFVHEGISLGASLTIDGAVTTRYLLSNQQYANTRKRLADVRKKLAKTADSWGQRNVPSYRQAAWLQADKDLAAGKLNVGTWRKNLSYLLFQDREPTKKFLKFKDDLADRIAKLREILQASAYDALVFDEVASIGTSSSTTAQPTAPTELRIIRETLIAGVPMRENYKAEWTKYRREAMAYQKKQAER